VKEEGKTMKKDFYFLAVFCLFLLLMCTPVRADSSSMTSDRDQLQTEQRELQIPVASSESIDGQLMQKHTGPPEIFVAQSADEEDDYFMDYEMEEEDEEAPIRIADPIYPWNKAMYHFNDKVYFWLMKPVAQGYSYVIPEDARISARNFFQNIYTPIRFVNNLLQLKMKKAGNELIRFFYNSTAGILGLVDAAKTDLDIPMQKEDLGQTFGHYGIGQGFYIVWPFLGPSSLRDSVGMVGDLFLDPLYYLEPQETALYVTIYDKGINEVSLRVGDYEDLKKAAIDPYVSIRDAYIQYRKKQVEQ
jgi:phospholipid-binding lipoprotein MlaA